MLTCRLPSQTLRRDLGEERQISLVVQGFNANRVATGHSFGQATASATQSNQVNILNLPLPEANIEEGISSRPSVRRTPVLHLSKIELETSAGYV